MDENKEKIISALEESGVLIDGSIEEANINQYFDDSIQFMTFLVNLENIFEIEFPNELLVFENFDNINNICEMIQELKGNEG